MFLTAFPEFKAYELTLLSQSVHRDSYEKSYFSSSLHYLTTNSARYQTKKWKLRYMFERSHNHVLSYLQIVQEVFFEPLEQSFLVTL